MTDEELEYFRTHIGRILRSMFTDRPISSPTAYFSIWHDVRKVLEEELSLVVNKQLRSEVEKIQQSS